MHLHPGSAVLSSVAKLGSPLLHREKLRASTRIHPNGVNIATVTLTHTAVSVSDTCAMHHTQIHGIMAAANILYHTTARF